MGYMKTSMDWTRRILHDVISIVRFLVQALPEQARLHGKTFFLQLIATSPKSMSPILTNVDLMQCQKSESHISCQIDFRIVLPLFFVGMHSTLDTLLDYDFGRLLHNVILSSLSSKVCTDWTQYQEFMLAMREVFWHFLLSSSNAEEKIDNGAEKQLTSIFLHHVDSMRSEATIDDSMMACSNPGLGWTDEKSLLIKYLFQALVIHSNHFSDVVHQLIPPLLFSIPTTPTPSAAQLIEDCILSMAYGCLWISKNDEWTQKQLNSNFHLIFYGLVAVDEESPAALHSTFADTERCMYLTLFHMKNAFVKSRIIEKDSDSLLLHKMLDTAEEILMLRNPAAMESTVPPILSHWNRQSAEIIQDIYNCYLTVTLHQERPSIPSRLFHCIQMLQKRKLLATDELEHTEELVLSRASPSSDSDLLPQRPKLSRVQSFTRTWKRPPFMTSLTSSSPNTFVWKRATGKWKSPHAA